MSKIDIVKAELLDPLGRGYSGMSDAAVADDMNTVYRTRVRAGMSGDEIFQATDNTEWAALTADEKNLWMSFCGRDSLDPSGTSNVAFVEDLFGNPSTTRTNLINLRTENISRSQELGISVVEVDIWDARNS